MTVAVRLLLRLRLLLLRLLRLRLLLLRLLRLRRLLLRLRLRLLRLRLRLRLLRRSPPSRTILVMVLLGLWRLVPVRRSRFVR